jgi:hypothetical protein
MRDPDLGLVVAHPWRKLSSGGYSVMQIDTRPSPLPVDDEPQ